MFVFSRWVYVTMAIILVLGGLSLWYLQRDTDEMQIRRTLRSLAALGSRQPDETPAAVALKLNQTDRVFAPECSIDVDQSMFTGATTPTELTGILTRYQGMFREVKAEIRALEITVTAPDAATATFSGSLLGEFRSGEKLTESRDLICHLKRIDGRWLIDRIALLEVLKK